VSIMKAFAIAPILIILAGCTASEQAHPPAQDPSPALLRVCVMQDLSGSIVETRTPRISQAELKALTELVKARGGELGFGIIQEQSDRGLVRFAVDERPAPPPPEPHNPLYRPRWEQQRQQAEAERNRWEAQMKLKEQGFLKEAQARLASPLARRTDVCGAIRRCDLMLAEPCPAGTLRFLMLVTDGLHNVRGSACPESLAANTRLLLVNGSGVQGIVERYQPIRFESIEAGIKYIKEALK
jgi:hypothetical protein